MRRLKATLPSHSHNMISTMKYLLQTSTARLILMVIFVVIVVRVCSYDPYEAATYQETEKEQ